MHDPSTLAFSIKRPWRSKPSAGWPQGYRPTWIDIWHEDPLKFDGKCGCRSDDSCGWFSPPLTVEQHKTVEKLAAEQYRDIFGKAVAERDGKDYAYVCYEPTAYDAVYWLWRAIKHKFQPRGPWMYGCKMTSGELEQIYSLAASPVDNVRVTVSSARNDEGEFRRLCFIVARAYFRHHRPWWRHPRWHVHHWRFRFPGLQPYWRWLFGPRCFTCGGRIGPIRRGEGYPVQDGRGLHHSECLHSRPAACVPIPFEDIREGRI